ncbi:hypothetical protein [Saccharococcus caldoxylosilyticus]|uniref:Polysaccharide polymerase n=1 Tax=Saccharococcus caldoxylosilyticus TaxID=81408 RepID=A0A150M4C4_9BACL|nr:hypothetical protein [Parageobacillus caldoxylosilyticus]KYD19072.1 hypothetical protein B4119_3902 [Parageobacillus caldoxylosilyticus]
MGVILVSLGVYFLWRNEKLNLFLLYLASYLIVPSNQYIESILGVFIFGIDIRNLLTVMLLVLLILDLGKSVIKIKKLSFYYVLVTISIIIIYYLLGYANENEFVFLDFKIYLNLVILYFIISQVIKDKEDIKKVMNSLIFFGLLYALVVIYIYTFHQNDLPTIYGDRLYSWWGKRIYFTNNSFLIISTFLATYLMFKGEKRFYHILVIISGLTAILMSQTKTLIIVVLINYILMFLISFIIQIKNSEVKLKLLFLSPFLAILISFITLVTYFHVKENADGLLFNVIERFSDDGESLTVRNITNNIYFSSILNNPLGQGLGKELVLYDVNGSIASSSLFIDNAFITVGIKAGIVGMLLLLILVCRMEFNILKIYLISGKTIDLLLLFIHITFLIIIAIMNAQILYSPSISLLYITMYVLINRRKQLYLAKINQNTMNYE